MASSSDSSNNRQSKADRHKAAREQVRALQAEAARRDRRNRMIVIVISAVLVVLLGAIIYLIVSNKEEAQNARDIAAGESATGIADTTSFSFGDNAFKDALPKNMNEHGGISVGDSLAAGTENAGKPNVQIYFDYLCVHCNELEKTFGAKLTDMAKKGEITLTYYPVNIMGQEVSLKGAVADFFLAEHAPEQFLDFHNTVFEELSEPVFSKNAKLPTAADLVNVAKEVGVADSVVNDLKKVLDDGSMDSLVEQATKQFQNNGLKGTPSVIVDNVIVNNWPDSLMTAITRASAK